ncbi:rhomboid family intramembrane serine protease [Corynebacterium caspium]|nr:rhomboid family intramembrane serine protease [Corynebacterium caspium]
MQTRGESLKRGFKCALGYVALIWVVHIFNVLLGGYLRTLGIAPRDTSTLWHILTAPWVHNDYAHLMGNTVPGAIFCFLIGMTGKKVWWEVTAFVVLIGGVGIWFIGGVGTIHFGASILVYGWLSYLIVRGIFNRSFRQTFLGIILGFCYSGLAWGLLPLVEGMSWQGHLFGAIGGIIAGMIITSDDPLPKSPKKQLLVDEANPYRLS